MSMYDAWSYWRCPNCLTENKYNLTWQHFYEFKEITGEYSIEKCSLCSKEYYVDNREPNPYCFRMNRGNCKNDYVKDMVLNLDEKLTVVSEYLTV